MYNKDIYRCECMQLHVAYSCSKEAQYVKECQLTYCCSEVLHTAMKAAMKPLPLTLTSVTVQTPTPIRTTPMLSLVSLE